MDEKTEELKWEVFIDNIQEKFEINDETRNGYNQLFNYDYSLFVLNPNLSIEKAYKITGKSNLETINILPLYQREGTGFSEDYLYRISFGGIYSCDEDMYGVIVLYKNDGSPSTKAGIAYYEIYKYNKNLNNWDFLRTVNFNFYSIIFDKKNTPYYITLTNWRDDSYEKFSVINLNTNEIISEDIYDLNTYYKNINISDSSPSIINASECRILLYSNSSLLGEGIKSIYFLRQKLLNVPVDEDIIFSYLNGNSGGYGWSNIQSEYSFPLYFKDPIRNQKTNLLPINDSEFWVIFSNGYNPNSPNNKTYDFFKFKIEENYIELTEEIHKDSKDVEEEIGSMYNYRLYPHNDSLYAYSGYGNKIYRLKIENEPEKTTKWDRIEVDKEKLQNISNALNEKLGTNKKYTLDEMEFMIKNFLRKKQEKLNFESLNVPIYFTENDIIC